MEKITIKGSKDFQREREATDLLNVHAIGCAERKRKFQELSADEEYYLGLAVEEGLIDRDTALWLTPQEVREYLEKSI